MRMLKITTLLAATLTTFAQGTGHAQTRAGSFGVGMESPLALGNTTQVAGLAGRLPGLSLRYQISDGFGLQAIVAYRVGRGKNTGVANTRTSVVGTFLRAHFVAVQHEIVALGFFGGFGFVNAKNDPPGPGDTVTRFLTFEAGLRPELWIADRASIHLQVGLTFNVATGDSTDFADEGFGFSIGHNAGLLGGGGITVWFGGAGPGSAAASDPEPPPPSSGYGAPPPVPVGDPAGPSDPNAPPPDWESGDPGW